MNQIKLDGVWGKLDTSNCFQGQSFVKRFRQSVVFISVFQEIFISTDKTFISVRGQSTRQQFCEVIRFS